MFSKSKISYSATSSASFNEQYMSTFRDTKIDSKYLGLHREKFAASFVVSQDYYCVETVNNLPLKTEKGRSYRSCCFIYEGAWSLELDISAQKGGAGNQCIAEHRPSVE